MKHQQQSANEFYSQYYGTEEYHSFEGFNLTDGVFNIAGEEECFWFLQIISGNQRNLSDQDFQTWKLERLDADSFKIEATDGNENVIFEDRISSDFYFRELIIWVEGGVFMLPSER